MHDCWKLSCGSGLQIIEPMTVLLVRELWKTRGKWEAETWHAPQSLASQSRVCAAAERGLRLPGPPRPPNCTANIGKQKSKLGAVALRLLELNHPTCCLFSVTSFHKFSGGPNLATANEVGAQYTGSFGSNWASAPSVCG
jgi:hypothetical protein